NSPSSSRHPSLSLHDALPISTDMLSSGAGRIVPFGDSEAIGREIRRFVEEPHLLLAARDEAQRIGSGLAWSSVAEQTAAVLKEADRKSTRLNSSHVSISYAFF